MSISGPQPVAAIPSGSATSSGAMNSGVPPGSVGSKKKHARLKSISFTGEVDDLHSGPSLGKDQATEMVQDFFKPAAARRLSQGNHSYDDLNMPDSVKNAMCQAANSQLELCCVHEWPRTFQHPGNRCCNMPKLPSGDVLADDASAQRLTCSQR